MINPIQQNVVFKGGNTNLADNFKGTPAVKQSVRQDYISALNSVASVQENMKHQVNNALGNKLDCIA